MNRLRLKAQLVRHEGLRLKPYRDTVGKLTIGVGRDLEDEGITEAEATVLLDNDIARIEGSLATLLLAYSSLDDVRQRVLCDLAFNLGVRGLMAFRDTIAAVNARDFAKAAAAMLDSKWAKELPARSAELAQMMKEGTDVAVR